MEVLVAMASCWTWEQFLPTLKGSDFKEPVLFFLKKARESFFGGIWEVRKTYEKICDQLKCFWRKERKYLPQSIVRVSIGP